MEGTTYHGPRPSSWLTRLIQTTRQPILRRLLSLARTTASLRPPRWKGALRRFVKRASRLSITNIKISVTALGSASVPVPKDGSSTPFDSGKSSCTKALTSNVCDRLRFLRRQKWVNNAIDCLSAIGVKRPQGGPISAGRAFPCPVLHRRNTPDRGVGRLTCWAGRADNPMWWRCCRGPASTAPRAARRRGRWHASRGRAQPVRRSSLVDAGLPGRALNHAVDGPLGQVAAFAAGEHGIVGAGIDGRVPARGTVMAWRRARTKTPRKSDRGKPQKSMVLMSTCALYENT